MRNFENPVGTVFREAIVYFLNKSFDIRVGEYRRVLLMQLNIFLIITTLLIVKPIANSLFLSSFGYAYLPTAFLLVAVFAIAVSWLYSRMLSTRSFGSIMIRTLIGSVASLFVFGVLLQLNVLVQVVLLLFYIWVALFAVVSSSQFWILANIIFNAREAKRVFGFIGAGAIAGGIFGGYLTSLVVSSIGSENLIFLSMLVLLPSIWITKQMWKEREQETGHYKQLTVKEDTIPGNPYQLIRKSRHLTYLAGIIGIGVIVAKLVDYQFSAIASLAITDPDRLTSFFGFWFSNFNLFSLFIQLFITRKVVGVFGVGTSLLFLPGAIFIGALLMLFFPILGAAVFIKFSDASLKQSLNKSATELLALPIPVEIKNKTKSFIDVFVDSAATGIGGLILIFLVHGFNLSTNWISLIIIGLLIIWGYFAWQVRKEYLKSFKYKISKKAKRDRSEKKEINQDSVIGGLIRQLETVNEKQILFVIHKMREVPNERFYPGLKKLLNHESAEVRAEAIVNLRAYLNHNLSGVMNGLVGDSDSQVRVNAFEYLLMLAPGNRIELLEGYLKHADQKIKDSALLALARETRGNYELQNWYSFGKQLQKRVVEMNENRDPAAQKEAHLFLLKVIGLSGASAYFHYVEDGFASSDPDIVRQSVIAAGYSVHPHFVNHLFAALGNPENSAEAVNALANYGIQVFSFFEEMIEAEDVSVDVVRKLPAIAEKIESQKSIAFLFYLLDYEDYLVHIESLKALTTIKANFPNLYFDKRLVMSRIVEETHLYQNSLLVLNAYSSNSTGWSGEPENVREARMSLIGILERRLDGSLERIFRLLGLRYPPEDIFTAFKGIQSDKAEVRLNAVDFLDNLLETRLKKVLIPILEVSILHPMTEPTKGLFAEKAPDEFSCYKMLLEGVDIKLKLAVFYLLEQLADRAYLPLVESYLNARNPKVKTFAQKAKAAMDKEP